MSAARGALKVSAREDTSASHETRNQLAAIGLEVRGLADLVWTQQDHDLSTEARFALKLWLERVEAGRYQDAEKDRPNGGRDTAVAR